MAEQLTLDLKIGATQDASYRRVIGQTERDVSGLDRAQSRLGAGARSATAGILGATAALAPYALGLGAVAAPITAAIGAAIEFESTMADVRKVVDFETPTQFEQMRQGLLSLSTEIPMTVDGLGEIVAAAGRTGKVARKDLLDFAADAAKMGVAFDMSAGEAGSAMTGMMSIFGLNRKEVLSLGDAFNFLDNNMDATARDIVNITERVGGQAKTFGLTAEQVGALGATFRALKTPPEMAATAMDAMLLKLSTAPKQGKAFQEALASIGYGAADLKESIGRDAQGALLSFLEAVERSPDVIGTLSDLFGAEHAGKITKLVGSLDTYRDALKLIGDETRYAGAMQREYEVRADTTANKLVLFGNQVERLKISLGDLALPPLTQGLEKVGNYVDSAADTIEKMKTFTLEEWWQHLGEEWSKELQKFKQEKEAQWGEVTSWLGWDPLGTVKGAWEPVDSWLKSLNLLGGVKAEWGDASTWLGWDPQGTVKGAWEPVDSWLKSLNLLGGVKAEWGDASTWLGWDPQGTVKGAWEPVDSWLKSLNLLGGVKAEWGDASTWLGWDPQGTVEGAWEPVDSWLKSLNLLGGVKAEWGDASTWLGWDPQGTVKGAWEPVDSWLKSLNLLGGVKAEWGDASTWLGWDPQGTVEGAWEPVDSWLKSLNLLGGVKAEWGDASTWLGWDPLETVKDAWEPVDNWLKSLNPLGRVEAALERVKGWLFGGDAGSPDAGSAGSLVIGDAGSPESPESPEADKAIEPFRPVKAAWEGVKAWWGGDEESPGAAASPGVGNAAEVIRLPEIEVIGRPSDARLDDIVAAIQASPGARANRAAIAGGLHVKIDAPITIQGGADTAAARSTIEAVRNSLVDTMRGAITDATQGLLFDNPSE